MFCLLLVSELVNSVKTWKANFSFLYTPPSNIKVGHIPEVGQILGLTVMKCIRGHSFWLYPTRNVAKYVSKPRRFGDMETWRLRVYDYCYAMKFNVFVALGQG